MIEAAIPSRSVESAPVRQPRQSPKKEIKTQETLPLTYQKRRTEPIQEAKPEVQAERPDVLPPLALLEVEKPVVTNEAAIQMNAAILKEPWVNLAFLPRSSGTALGHRLRNSRSSPVILKRTAARKNARKCVFPKFPSCPVI